MKAFVSRSLLVTLLFCGSVICPAQNPSRCDLWRKQVSDLEGMDITVLAPSIRRIYEESLLKTYSELNSCLDQEILVTKDPQELSALRAEKGQTEQKITILRISLNLPSITVRSNSSDSASPVSPIEGAENSISTAPAATDIKTRASASSRPAKQPGSLNMDSTRNTSTAAPSTTTQLDRCAQVLAGADYSDPPSILVDIVKKVAADVVRRKDSNRAVAALSQMVLYTIFDSASPTSSEMLRKLEAYQYLSETARTDKQLGASANSEGSVSAIEKPSFAQLLGFAIEHGGITRKNDGTNLTLSTSLYSLYAMNGGDTAETYHRAGFLNRIGVSTTFAVDDKTNDLANARRNNLSQWSVKTRLFGDRSTRSPHFQRFWNEKVRPLISERLQSLGSAVESLSTRLESYDSIERASRNCLPKMVGNRMGASDYASADDSAQKKIIADFILSHLKSNVYDQVKGGSLKLDAKEIADVEQEFLPRLKSALDNLVLADAEVKRQIDSLQKGPLGTFAYTNYRIPAGSDYSEAKFLFEQDESFFRPLKLTGNLGLSFYNRPDRSLNQQKLRDVSAALSFEGSSRSPFTEAENQSKITYSFVGRYERLFENRRLKQRKPDIGTFQFVMEIPFFKGLSLPLSATYASATEEEKKNHFRFNFGMRLDTDKLFELLRATGNK